MRYFNVSFDIWVDGKRHSTATAQFASEQFFSEKQLLEGIKPHERYKNLHYNKINIMVTSIYEFKSADDYYQFIGEATHD